MKIISLFPGIPSAPAACCSPEAIILCVRLHKWLLWIRLRASGGNGYQSKMNSSDKKGFLFMQTFLITKNERGKKKENRIHGSDGSVSKENVLQKFFIRKVLAYMSSYHTSNISYISEWGRL